MNARRLALSALCLLAALIAVVAVPAEARERAAGLDRQTASGLVDPAPVIESFLDTSIRFASSAIQTQGRKAGSGTGAAMFEPSGILHLALAAFAGLLLAAAPRRGEPGSRPAPRAPPSA